MRLSVYLKSLPTPWPQKRLQYMKKGKSDKSTATESYQPLKQLYLQNNNGKIKRQPHLLGCPYHCFKNRFDFLRLKPRNFLVYKNHSYLGPVTFPRNKIAIRISGARNFEKNEKRVLCDFRACQQIRRKLSQPVIMDTRCFAAIERFVVHRISSQ